MVKNNEEYKFEDSSEYTDNENFEAPAKVQRTFGGEKMGASDGAKPPFPIKNKKMVIIIAIFVGLFLITQLVKLFSRPKETAKEQTTIVSTPIPKQSAADTTSPGISALSGKYAANEEKIQQLQKDVEDIKTDVVEVNKAIYNLSVAVQQLTNEVQKLSSKQTPTIQKNIREKRTPYHIRAIVNGRAWLEVGSGINAITVRIGSNLGQYGKVNNIDEINGIVSTDRGAIIRYGNNDV